MCKKIKLDFIVQKQYLDFAMYVLSFSRIYIEFNPSESAEIVYCDGQQYYAAMPGKICREVYCAIRQRQLKIKNEIPCLP